MGAHSCLWMSGYCVTERSHTVTPHSSPHTGGEEEVSGFDLILDTQLDV